MTIVPLFLLCLVTIGSVYLVTLEPIEKYFESKKETMKEGDVERKMPEDSLIIATLLQWVIPIVTVIYSTWSIVSHVGIWFLGILAIGFSLSRLFVLSRNVKLDIHIRDEKVHFQMHAFVLEESKKDLIFRLVLTWGITFYLLYLIFAVVV